jgi:hypothetical protein
MHESATTTSEYQRHKAWATFALRGQSKMTRALLFAALVLTALPAVAQLQVQYGAKSLTITGASARADVVVIGIVHTNSKGFESIQTPQSIERTDSTGAVTVTVARPSFRSVWLIVDLRSGEFIVSSPPGYVVRRTPVPPGAIDRAGHSLLHSFPSADLFIVRKGQGAWHARATEGGQNLLDGRRDMSVDHFKPVGATPPAPPVLVPNDIVMVFNASYMEFWATKLTPADLSGAK